MNYRNSILGLLSALLVLSACSSGKSASGGTLSGEQVARILTDRSENLRSLRGKGTLVISNDGASRSVRAEFALRQTDSLVMSIYGPFSILLGKMQANPLRLQFYDVMNNHLYEGAPSADNFNSIAQLPLSYEQMLLLLRGEIPGGFADFQIAPPTEGVSVFLRRTNDGAERIKISAQTNAITEYVRKNSKGETVLIARYDEFSVSNGISVAHNNSVQFPLSKIDLRMHFDDVEANIAGLLFSFQVPADARKTKF